MPVSLKQKFRYIHNAIVKEAQDFEDAVGELNREAIALNALTDDHINEENDLLLSAFEEHFSPEELGKIMDQALEEMGSKAPELMMQAVPWMFKAQSVDDREGMLRSWMVMMPPDQLPGILQIMSTGVSPQEWQEMKRRIPDLQ